MEAALRTLGSFDKHQRVQRYISSQRQHEPSLSWHDVDCLCDECHRQQVLGQRRDRRKVPRNARTSLSEQARARDPIKIGGGNEPSVKVRPRRHRVDENARRGESKIGRAALLRPGRITLPVEGLREVPVKGEGDAVELSPNADASTRRDADEMGLEDEADCAQAGAGSWYSDQHSFHSNLLHQAAKGHGRTSEPYEAADREAGRKMDCTEHYFNDFFTRNPAAKANGWLALPHHRRTEGWVAREGRESVIDRAARGLIKAQESRLVGLLPKLSCRRARCSGDKRRP